MAIYEFKLGLTIALIKVWLERHRIWSQHHRAPENIGFNQMMDIWR